MAGIEPSYASVTAEAPAGIGNLAVGFDILGQALEAPLDRVTLTARTEPGLEIVSISGSVTELPRDPSRNSATAGILRLCEEHHAGFGLEVAIEKGISLGSGMGGSAASAVAGVVAAAAILGIEAGAEALLPYALDGEEAATGARHADNAASALLGGVVLVQAGTAMKRLATPANVFSVLVHPQLEVETRKARGLLPECFEKEAVIAQSGNLAGFVAACHDGDLSLLSRSLCDVLVEPHRASLITGFSQVKAAALRSGALGCSISGSGPSVFAWCVGRSQAHVAGAAMQKAFARAGIASDLWVSRIDAPGARVLTTCAT